MIFETTLETSQNILYTIDLKIALETTRAKSEIGVKFHYQKKE